LDPFFEPKYFEEAHNEFEKVLVKVQPFTITLKEFGYFSNKKGNILWIKPESSPPEALSNFQQTLQNVYPICNDIRRFGQYTPHITLGRLNTKQDVQSIIARLQEKFEPITFTTTEIQILSKVGNEKYEVRDTVGIGGTTVVPHFASVPF